MHRLKKGCPEEFETIKNDDAPGALWVTSFLGETLFLVLQAEVCLSYWDCATWFSLLQVTYQHSDLKEISSLTSEHSQTSNSFKDTLGPDEGGASVVMNTAFHCDILKSSVRSWCIASSAKRNASNFWHKKRDVLAPLPGFQKHMEQNVYWQE